MVRAGLGDVHHETVYLQETVLDLGRLSGSEHRH